MRVIDKQGNKVLFDDFNIVLKHAREDLIVFQSDYGDISDCMNLAIKIAESLIDAEGTYLIEKLARRILFDALEACTFLPNNVSRFKLIRILENTIKYLDEEIKFNISNIVDSERYKSAIGEALKSVV